VAGAAAFSGLIAAFLGAAFFGAALAEFAGAFFFEATGFFATAGALLAPLPELDFAIGFLSGRQGRRIIRLRNTDVQISDLGAVDQRRTRLPAPCALRLPPTSRSRTARTIASSIPTTLNRFARPVAPLVS